MIVLGIETCSPSGGVAFFDGERILASQTINSSRAHSRMILPAVELAMGELGMEFADLGAVAVSRGPGSFTGVRVGMTLGKALCESGTPPLVLVSPLAALAHRAFAGEAVEAVAPMLNARQGEVYGALYPVVDGRLRTLDIEEFACRPEELVERWQGRVLVAGEGAREYRDAWPVDRTVFARPDRMDCHPESVAVLGWEAATRGEFADPETASVTYLREATVSRPKKRK